MDKFEIESWVQQAPDLLISYGIKMASAIAIYIIGKWCVKGFSRLLVSTMNARKIDETVVSFMRNIVYYALLTIVIVVALGQVGVQTASFVAIIGAAGLAVGFALQGSLSNFAAGVLVILFRPFKLGDFVEAGGTAGVVNEISIFSTILKTPDNKTVIVANSAVMGGNITNYSTEPTRRVDILVGVSYGSSIQKVKSSLQSIADAESRLLGDKEVTIAVSELADSSVNLVFRVWVKTADYWGVKFDLTEQIKLRFDEEGIDIPFPQMDVHVEQSAA